MVVGGGASALLALGQGLAEDVVHRREAHDLVARQPPSLLDDPAQRTILARGLLRDLGEHVFGEVEALLAFVGACHGVPGMEKSTGADYTTRRRRVVNSPP